jgi:hypothetical protein
MTSVTVTEERCHKWPRICLTCHKHFSFVTYHRVCKWSNTTGTTMEKALSILPEHLSSPLAFSGVRVARSLVFCVCSVDRCLSFYPFVASVFCPSRFSEPDYPISFFHTLLWWKNVWKQLIKKNNEKNMTKIMDKNMKNNYEQTKFCH